MAQLIGMDEAGLGPNLGPFVVAVTVWDVPTPPRKFDFWKTFAEVLTNSPGEKETRLHIADSKQVFQPHRGFGALERGVMTALRMIGHEPTSFGELRRLLSPQNAANETDNGGNPLLNQLLAAAPDAMWYDDGPMPLPCEPHDYSHAETWQRCCEKSGVRLISINAAIIEPREFNQLIREYDNKSLLVSRVAFHLLRSVWKFRETETFVVGDKHGGRNRYDQLLSEVLDGEMIFRLEEAAERSEYRVGKATLRFQPRAEDHGPVALASMTAKYVRELAMTQFNRFWSKQIDGLKPTQGYPVDAKRFREQIRTKQNQLGIEDDILWRSR